MKLAGRTTDGKRVFAGCFQLVDTHGLPLEFVIDGLADGGAVVDWLDFIRDALRAGWSRRTLLARIDEAVIDARGRDEIKKRVRLLLCSS